MSLISHNFNLCNFLAIAAISVKTLTVWSSSPKCVPIRLTAECLATSACPYSDFQPFSSHSTCKLITKILLHTPKYIFFDDLTKNRYNFDSFTLTAIVLAVVLFFIFYPHLRTCFLNLERGRVGDRGEEKHQCVRYIDRLPFLRP